MQQSSTRQNSSSSDDAIAAFRPAEGQRYRFMFTRLSVLIFMFVCVRGPLFRVEDLTELGWDRVSSWKVLRNLVKAGVLQKFDRKSYGLTEDSQKWFRSAFGGGVNDATFAYSVMGAESWSKARLSYFEAELTSMWEKRPERVKQDPARAGLTIHRESKDEENVEYFSALEALLFEKVEESHYLATALKQRRRSNTLAEVKSDFA